MEDSGVSPVEAQQRRATAWAAIRDAEPMAVPDPVELRAELQALRERTISGPESMRDLINEGRKH